MDKPSRIVNARIAAKETSVGSKVQQFQRWPSPAGGGCPEIVNHCAPKSHHAIRGGLFAKGRPTLHRIGRREHAKRYTNSCKQHGRGACRA
jgi:hypothetical protein